MSAPPSRGFSLLVMLGLIGTSMAVSWTVMPEIMKEAARDWEAYRAAGQRILTGQPLYVWDGVRQGASAYLYPPLMAWLWSQGMDPTLWLLGKVGALAAFTWLGPIAGHRLWPIGALLAFLVALSPGVIHDLVLGNVMVYYAAAIVLSLARPGWLGALPLGIVIALAMKPFVGPYLLWLGIRRGSDLKRVGAVVLILSLAGAILVGPGRYVEYATNLPEMAVMNRPFTGNVGLSSISPMLAFVAVIVAWIVTLATALRLEAIRGVAVAVAMTVFAQPTIGIAYGVTLTVAAAAAWRWAPRRAAPLVVTAPLLLLLPVVAAIAVALVALLPTASSASSPALASRGTRR